MSTFVHVRGRRIWRRLLGVAGLAAAVVAATCGGPAVAVAQEFVKVENAAREQLPAPEFVGAAYGFIWFAILVYVFFVARGLGRVRAEVEDLRRRLDDGGRGAASGGR
jgi:CcmD family protein